MKQSTIYLMGASTDSVPPSPSKIAFQDHFFVGNTVNLYAHEFMIISADEPTLRYMERNRDKFPHSYIRVSSINQSCLPAVTKL